MDVAAVIASVVLALLLAVSAVGKLVRMAPVVASVTGVGWPADRLWVLAAIELLGTAGLLVGIAVPVLGVLAAVGAVLYFLGAVLAHLRVRESPGGAVPPLVVAVVTLVLVAVRA